MVRQRDIIQALKPCSEKPKTLCNDINCIPCYKKSFKSALDKIPNIEIVDKNIDPRQILKYSLIEFLFLCLTCSHTFNKKVKSFTQGEYCIYCTSKPIKLCDKEDCKFCPEKSFASHEKSKCWEKKLFKCIKQYDEPSAIYINNDDIYKNHIDSLNLLT